VRLRVATPDGAAAEDVASLPMFEIGPLSGAAITLRAGYRGDFGLARIACVSAPARGFAPGVEDLVFGRATQIARSVLPNVTRLDAGPARATASGFEQRLVGDAVLDDQASPVVARHVLAFTDRAGAVVCSIVCVERASGACAVVDQASFEGELAPPPPPSLAVRALFASVEHPAASLGALLVVAFAFAFVLLRRRPRSLPRPFD
jgi:hypothetical protein